MHKATSRVGHVVLLMVLLVLGGCEYDLESGSYHAEATVKAYYPDGEMETLDKEFDLGVQLGTDAVGRHPDVLVFTICQDAIESLAYSSCYEPIEVTAQDNKFGGEEIFYASYTMQDGGTEYGCDQREDVVINGTITSSTTFDFSLTYVANIEDWGNMGCSSHYPYPTSVQMTGSAVLP